MTESLRKKAEHGAFWSAVDAGGARAVQFIIGVVLARLLLPAQFGLIGMLAIFMAIAQAFLTSGFGHALIQKKEVTRVDASSVFYFNLVIGVIFAGLLCLAAPWIATFYRQPSLLLLTRGMSLVIVINSFVVVQTALLTRSLNFKTQAKVNLIASMGSGFVGVAMAASGFGVWSLVGQQLSSAFLRASLLWLFNRWRPGLVFSYHSLRTMFTFGSRLLASSLLNEVFVNIYYVAIGRLFDPAALGFYARAKRLEELPSLTLSSIVTRVSFPAFAAIQGDVVRLKRAMRKALCTLIFVNSPLMIGLLAAGRLLVVVLLTEKWLPCVPYLRLLSLVGLLYPLHVLNMNVLLAGGHSNLFLRLSVIKHTLQLVALGVTIPWGITAIIGGQVVHSVLCLGINSYFTARMIDYPPGEQLRDVFPYFLLSGGMGAIVYAVQYLPVPSNIVLVMIQITVGVLVYTVSCAFLGMAAAQESWMVIKERLSCVKKGVCAA